MKKNFPLCIILFSITTSAQISKTSILNVVLTDSIICKYMSEHGEIDTATFVLFEKSGYYFYNDGIIEFKEQNCEKAPSCSGIITKLKAQKTKALVKIYFRENNTYYTKVKLERENINKPWQIKSRLIYRNFQLPRKQPRLIYYSYDS